MWLHNGNDEWLGTCVLMSDHSGFFGVKKRESHFQGANFVVENPSNTVESPIFLGLLCDNQNGCYYTLAHTHSVTCMSCSVPSCWPRKPFTQGSSLPFPPPKLQGFLHVIKGWFDTQFTPIWNLQNASWERNVSDPCGSKLVFGYQYLDEPRWLFWGVGVHSICGVAIYVATIWFA